ncbi:RagB/SusD family nutrient uptake outer membrane protein [Niabella sp. CJ426]|uniref:RagB/SusD family nutrient uptake outer membrane protein n=1 Tax=Niabella sp. CJ426 TaxID=3393740 RepID=UPI003D07D7C4
MKFTGITSLLFGMVLSSSCSKFLDIQPPTDTAETDKIFKNESTALSAIKGLYTQVRGSSTAILNGGLSFYPGVGSDELYNPSNLSTLQAFYTNGLLSDNITTGSMWLNSYQFIYTANLILEALNNSTSIDSGPKAGFRGEMLYMRGLVYFYLVNLFGDVPLVISSDYIGNSTIPRTSTTTVYNRVLDDLLESQRLLLPSNGSLPNTRISYMATTALLSRVQLFIGQWEQAEKNATIVIGSGKYRLEPDLNKVFLSSSPESIFQISKVNTNTSEGGAFIPSTSTALPVYAATEYLMNSFGLSDGRRLNWLKANTIAGKQYYYPFKYKVRSSTTTTEFNIVQRLAEIYLIRAEAFARQNKKEQAEFDLNLVRNRAGLESYVASNSTQLLDSIMVERQRELFSEWGHRWFDLKRTKRANVVLAERKAPNWQPTDSLYPIPASEIIYNPLLTQNPGYE